MEKIGINMLETNDFLSDHLYVNLSETYNCFIWTPPKTASTLANKIFNHFDFNHYQSINNKLRLVYNYSFHNHSLHISPEIKKYDLILTVRNPYESVASMWVKNVMYDKEMFQEAIEIFFYSKNDYNIRLQIL